MNEVAIGIIGLAVVLLMFLTGIELGFAMALVGFVGFSIIVSTKAALNLLAKDVFDVFASYGFTVIPLFVLMGQVAFNAGIAKRLYNAAYRFIDHIPGGLAMATVAGATAFKAICGSSPATAATSTSSAVPSLPPWAACQTCDTPICTITSSAVRSRRAWSPSEPGRLASERQRPQWPHPGCVGRQSQHKLPQPGE